MNEIEKKSDKSFFIRSTAETNGAVTLHRKANTTETTKILFWQGFNRCENKTILINRETL